MFEISYRYQILYFSILFLDAVVTFLESTYTLPLVGLTRLFVALNSVDFPAPDSPTIIKKSPSFISRFISFKASPFLLILCHFRQKNNRIEFNQSGYLQNYSSYNPNSSAACLTTSNSELTAGTRPVHP